MVWVMTVGTVYVGIDSEAYDKVGGEDIVQMVSQSQWGSSLIYGDGELRYRWDPQYIVVHWGGSTRERSTFEQATSTLRSWQRYHRSKGWQDIGYNYAIDELGNMYRLRGENHSGATSGTAPNGRKWNDIAINIVWIGGQKDEDGPSRAALETLEQYIAERGLPVLGHVETGKSTACPGHFLLDFIHGDRTIIDGVAETPPSEEHMDIGKGHGVAATVEKIQEALIEWDPNALPRWGADGDFGNETETWVKRFQAAKGLKQTGRVDDETWLLLA